MILLPTLISAAATILGAVLAAGPELVVLEVAFPLAGALMLAAAQQCLPHLIQMGMCTKIKI